MISFYSSSIFCDYNLLFDGDDSSLPSLSSSIPPTFSFPSSSLTFYFLLSFLLSDLFFFLSLLSFLFSTTNPSSLHPFSLSPLFSFPPLHFTSLLLPSTLHPCISSPFLPSFYPRSFLLPPFSLSAGRDVFRRLFAFQRSSVLEVCRFSASKWTAKVRIIMKNCCSILMRLR